MDRQKVIGEQAEIEFGALIHRAYWEDCKESLVLVFSDDGGETCLPAWEIDRDKLRGVLGALTAAKIRSALAEQRLVALNPCATWPATTNLAAPLQWSAAGWS